MLQYIYLLEECLLSAAACQKCSKCSKMVNYGPKSKHLKGHSVNRRGNGLGPHLYGKLLVTLLDCTYLASCWRASREKFTHENRTLPRIHLGPAGGRLGLVIRNGQNGPKLSKMVKNGHTGLKDEVQRPIGPPARSQAPAGPPDF